MGIVLLFVIPIAAFAGMAAALVGVSGFVIPWLGSHESLHWMMDPWFQALIKLVLLLLAIGHAHRVAAHVDGAQAVGDDARSPRPQPRVGSPLVGRLAGVHHFIADAIKMIMKEDFIPAKANKVPLRARGPVMAIVPVFITFAIVPYGAPVCPEQLAQAC